MAPSTPTRPPGTWRVVTWNLWWRFGDEPERRKGAIAATLADVDADVVCLQEVYGDGSGADDGRDLATGLGLEVAPTSPATTVPGGRRLTNAVLTRWPVLDAGAEVLPAADDRPGHRRASWVVLSSPFGPLPVVCTHLAFRFDESELRQRQARELARLAARLRDPDAEHHAPVLLCGDLNAVPDSDELRLLTGRGAAPVPGLVFNDCWPQVRDDPGHTWVRRNPYLAAATWPERRLDYVLVSWPRRRLLANPVQAFLVGDGPVDGVWPSDHLGVAVDLSLGDGPIGGGEEIAVTTSP